MRLAKVFFFAVLSFIFVFSSLVYADVPDSISYQGKLTTPAGLLIDGNYAMTFKIYDVPVLGAPLWTEVHPVVTVDKGVFSVMLGSITPLPATVFDGSVRYLGVQVGADPEMTPRKEIVSVAYAYRAGTAGADNDWIFPTAAGGTNPRPYLYTYGAWGIARYGNVLYGNEDSTHVNLGVAGTTGTSGQNYKYCTVGGGWSNTASGDKATVGGGETNTASGTRATVGGGGSNSATNLYATVGGGGSNSATNLYATVGGGVVNIASGQGATVGGGSYNTASGDSSTIGGGAHNTVTGNSATVGGGATNTASGEYTTVGGGFDNTASNSYTTVGGGYQDVASGSYATVGGGYVNTASWSYATVGGGVVNAASGYAATVGGGGSNTASNDYATVGGGYEDSATGYAATVGGGYVNISSGNYATVGGGNLNRASNSYATIGGGLQNTASAVYATIGGGELNSNSGDYSVIPGGYYDTLTSSGDYSMIFGVGVYVNTIRRVVFFEGTYSGRLGINRDDRDGGISYPIHVGTGTGNGNGAYLTNGGVWTNGSSRSFKENFQTLNSQELLKKISSLPVEAWNFKNSEERHIGPVAEDFIQAFDVGTVKEDGNRDNQYLSAEDIAGVALAGVKEMIKENQELKQVIEELRQRIIELEKTR